MMLDETAKETKEINYTRKIFDSSQKVDHTKKRAFLDSSGGVTIQRYDMIKYPQFEKLTEKQLGFFWLPHEVALLKDANDFKQLSKHEQHIFTSNLKRQILLDSVQGRAPALAFGPICSLPELENWIMLWTFNETIHSRSYTHIIRNIYPNPSIIFDEIMDIKEIVDCADDITKNYDDLLKFNALMESGSPEYNESTLKQHKRALWLALMSVNILEGIRFYVSFACSWAFAELKKMEGNAKIIKLIARDENVHLASTQTLLKLLPKDDPDYIDIRRESEQDAINLFISAAEQEKKWAEYLFKDGSMIGLNADILKEYVEWLTAKRMTAIGLKCPYKVTSSSANPLPWTSKWIAGSEVQVAPQETEISSYVIGGVKQDVTADTFSGFSL